MFSYKNFVNDSVYFSESAKDYFLKEISLPDDIKKDFIVNYGWYKLENKNLIINNKIVYTFKTKKDFLEIVHEVNFLNELSTYKDYKNITIFLNSDGVRVYATYEKQERILNISGSIATLMACKGYNMRMRDGSIYGDYTMSLYIEKFLKSININCFR